MNLDALRRFFSLDGVDKRPAYKPKFCRTRRCTLAFGHDEPHNIPAGVTKPFHGKPARNGRVTVHYEPRRSPKSAQVPGAAERMAHYRRRPVNTKPQP